MQNQAQNKPKRLQNQIILHKMLDEIDNLSLDYSNILKWIKDVEAMSARIANIDRSLSGGIEKAVIDGLCRKIDDEDLLEEVKSLSTGCSLEILLQKVKTAFIRHRNEKKLNAMRDLMRHYRSEQTTWNLHKTVRQIQTIVSNLKSMDVQIDPLVIIVIIDSILPKEISNNPAITQCMASIHKSDQALDDFYRVLYRAINRHRQLADRTNEPDRIIPPQQSQNGNQQQIVQHHANSVQQKQPNSPMVQCRYCKMPNHVISDCWKLQNKMRITNNANNSNHTSNGPKHNRRMTSSRMHASLNDIHMLRNM